MKLYIVIFCYFIFPGNVFADSVFVYSDREQVPFIGKYLYIYEDKSNQLSFSQAQKVVNYKKSKQDIPNYGLTSSTLWVKLHVKNTSSTEQLILEVAAPLIDQINFYTPFHNIYQETKWGQIKPFNDRKYRHPSYLLDVFIPKGETKTIYIKINSHDQIELPVRLTTPVKTFDLITLQNFIFGIYAGLMIIMILYNLFIYFTIRDKSYLYYVIYIFFVALTQASFQGYSFYLWPSFPKLEIQSIILSSIFVGFASVEFLRVFLNTRQVVPKLDKLFTVAYICYSIALVVTLAGFYTEAWALILIIVSPLSVYMLFVAFKIAQMGHRTAKYFAMAWTIFLLGVFIYTLKDFGILPYNYFTKYTMPIGSAIETILLSFALADRIKILQQEKEQSQLKALDALKENERIIKEQNYTLDLKVQERTVELQKSNEGLEVAMKELKDTQSQLVNSEKMASLGQLTAGVAHEINNPINFVSSSIKPLKRDINDLLSILAKYEEMNEGNVKVKEVEIKKLKAELDLDYLKEEIESLIKGIDEGASRTAEIVKGLKTFSRLDETDLKRVDLNEGIDSTLILLSSLMMGKIKVEKAYGSIPKIECYAGRLNQVFMNILNNAIHAILKKELNDGEGIINITTEEKGDNVIVRIKDNGTGIPDKIKNKIFDPFFTTKDVGEGTGLGLSIVYNIIESHKGKIVVKSEMGVGTEFLITLPKLQKE